MRPAAIKRAELQPICLACLCCPRCALQLVNVQSTNQFASHQLNRDTWRNEMVKSLVEANFVFFQARFLQI